MSHRKFVGGNAVVGVAAPDERGEAGYALLHHNRLLEPAKRICSKLMNLVYRSFTRKPSYEVATDEAYARAPSPTSFGTSIAALPGTTR